MRFILAQFPFGLFSFGNIAGNGRSAKFGWAMQDYNAEGAAGNAAAATADKGRAVVNAAALQLALLLAEVARLPLSVLVSGPTHM